VDRVGIEDPRVEHCSSKYCYAYNLRLGTVYPSLVTFNNTYSMRKLTVEQTEFYYRCIDDYPDGVDSVHMRKDCMAQTYCLDGCNDYKHVEQWTAGVILVLGLWFFIQYLRQYFQNR